MEKINKTKLVIIVIAVLVVIAAITLGVIFLGRKKEENPYANAGTISNTGSDFEALRVKNIEFKYDEEVNETKLDFAIENLTEEKIEQQEIGIHLLDENDTLISGLTVNVATIDPKGSYNVNITLGGNIQTIKKIKLAKLAEEAPNEENPSEETPAE